MPPLQCKHASKVPASLIVLCFFIAASPQKSYAAFDGSGDLFTEEEKEVRKTLLDEFAKIERPAGHILRGTLLYLLEPHKSKYYNVNSLGFRGEEVRQKAKNGFNIMVMGGSTVFGAAQSDSQTISAHLMGLLRRKHPDRDIQVYNLGISGYVFQREAALAKRLSKNLAPDLIIFYNGGNDLISVYNNGYVRFKNFNKEEETLFVKKQKENRSEVYREMVQNALKRIRGKMNFHPERDESKKIDAFVKGYLQDAGDVSNYFHRGLRFRAENIPVLFVLQPTVFTRKNRTSREQKIVDECGRPGYSDYVGRCIAKVKESAHAEGIAIHDFTGAFDEYGGELFRDEIHVNVAGNRMIADRLAELIEEGGYLNAVNR